MNDPRNPSSPNYIRRTARDDFQQAHRKSFWRGVLSWFTGKDNELLPFDEVRAQLPMNGQHYIGIRQIPIEQIIGSVSRYADFDRAFLPRVTHTRSRWESIDQAQIQDIILPPIEVYKIGSTYFVKDGNHRVSVARERGQVYIDAEVIEIDVPVPIGPDIRLADLVLKRELALFLRQTRLGDYYPAANFELTLAGQYDKLLEHISTHRWFMGERLDREITDEEAVRGWYEEVYRPLVNVIREQKILDQFPTRTESDLYLFIIEHLHYLRIEYNQVEISLEQAAEHFTENYATGSASLLGSIIRGLSKITGDMEIVEGHPPNLSPADEEKTGEAADHPTEE